MARKCVDMRSGFTLVELLVVIALISLLASMMIPSLMTARAKAQRAACKGNLRQLGVAMLEYVGDHEGFYPSYNTFITGGIWYEKLDLDYLGDSESDVWRCPSDPEYQFGFHTLSYAYNVNMGYYWALDDPIGQIVNRFSVSRPSSLMLLADGDSRYSTFRSFMEGDWRSVGQLHNEGANIAWLDGHVTWRPYAEVSASVLGWTDETNALWGHDGWYAK